MTEPRTRLAPRTDLREFESAAELLAHYAELRKRTGMRRRWKPPPKPVVEVLPPPLPPREPPATALIRRSQMDRIIYETCAYYRITRAAMVSSAREHKVLHPRSVAMYLIKQILHDRSEISLPVIGRIFHRDHSTVLNSIRNVTERLALGDHDTTQAVATIRAKLNEMMDYSVKE